MGLRWALALLCLPGLSGEWGFASKGPCVTHLDLCPWGRAYVSSSHGNEKEELGLASEVDGGPRTSLGSPLPLQFPWPGIATPPWAPPLC